MTGRTDAKAEARATEHVRKAAEAFRAGRYEEATTEFQAGYATSPRPAFILNMGHAQRQAGNPARARAYYKQFLELEPLSSQRADVEKAIAEIDAASATAGTAPPTPRSRPPRPLALPSPAVAGDDSEVPGDLKMAAREPIQKRDDGGPSFYQQWWFWGTVAGVVAAGVVAFLVVRSSGDDYTTAGTLGTLGR